MFQKSPKTEELLNYGKVKFGLSLSFVFILKCLSVVSCKLTWPRLSATHIAPTRQGKSLTTNELMKIFDKDFWLDLGSDFTINSLSRYRSQLQNGKALLVNDATVLFASKSQRTKDRLVGGLSELLSDGKYTYQDFGQKFSLEGSVTMVFNMTAQAYQNYKERLFGLTFSERCLTVFTVFSEKDRAEWATRIEKAKALSYSEMIKPEDIAKEVLIPQEYLIVIENLAKEFSYDSLNSPVGCQDLIKATMRANAALNDRNTVCLDDLKFAKLIQPYLVNPFSPYESKIVRLLAKGYSSDQICKELGKYNYKQQVERVKKRAQLRGIIDASD